MQLLIFLLTQ